MDLTVLAEKYVLGTLHAENLPTAASDALEAGYDSPSLRQLAGSVGDDNECTTTLFKRSLDELGIPIPTPLDAGRSWARRIAGDVVRGSVTPYEGARKIWSDIYARFPQLTELRVFVGLASEYEDDATHREQYPRQIVEACNEFLARSVQGG